MITENNYIGKGIYSIQDASRLLKVSPVNIRRWILGYSSQKGEGRIQHPPVLSHDFLPIDGNQALSFLDLLQIRFVAAFRDYGVSLQEIRLATERASEILQNRHPFAAKKFYTDGRRIIAQITHDGRDPELITLTQRQYEIHDALLPYLHKGIEYDTSDFAQRWWPLGKEHLIVVDPHKNYGKPTIISSRVPTETVFSAFTSMQSIQKVATWFEISETEVTEAINFEKLYAA